MINRFSVRVGFLALCTLLIAPPAAAREMCPTCAWQICEVPLSGAEWAAAAVTLVASDNTLGTIDSAWGPRAEDLPVGSTVDLGTVSIAGSSDRLLVVFVDRGEVLDAEKAFQIDAEGNASCVPGVAAPVESVAAAMTSGDCVMEADRLGLQGSAPCDDTIDHVSPSCDATGAAGTSSIALGLLALLLPRRRKEAR